MPSAARSISIPSSVTTARADTSRSSMASARDAFVTVPGTGTRPNESGSKPRRSVKRHGSSVVDGSGSSRYRVNASALATRRVPPVEHQRVAVGIVEEGHVADARVENVAGELDAPLLELAPRLPDIRHAQCDLRRVRGSEL